MNLTAIIPSGQQEITVNGLHQWDYGRKLEIHSNELPAIVEVHFACAGMDEAVVRVCETVEGVAVATIPDKCLEQTTPITAWVYEIDGTTGLTTKKITLPIIARTRPSVGEDIPVELSNAYTEAVTAMNEAVAKLSKGDVKVSNAVWADVAGLANNSLRAEEAKTASDVSFLKLHIYQIGMDVGDPNSGNSLGTLCLKFSITAPKTLSKTALDGIVNTPTNVTYSLEGFYVEGDSIYYPIVDYTCTSKADGYFYYTITLGHKTVLGRSSSYLTKLTIYNLY